MTIFDEKIGNDKGYVQKMHSKIVVNVIRTTLRNNIELTGIADNKANVLLSLNAIMLTMLVPLMSSYSRWLIDSYLYLPLMLLLMTCFTTIYLAAKVLQPPEFTESRDINSPSPFFFGNFHDMEAQQYFDYLKNGLSSPNLLSAHLSQDLYFVGKRLGHKMSWIRLAFKLFTTGMFLSIITTVFVLVVND